MSVIFSTVLVKTENVEDVLQVPTEMHLYFCLFHSVNPASESLRLCITWLTRPANQYEHISTQKISAYIDI